MRKFVTLFTHQASLLAALALLLLFPGQVMAAGPVPLSPPQPISATLNGAKAISAVDVDSRL